MMKSRIMRVGEKKTQSLLCAAHKGTGMTLLKASVYVRLQKPVNDFFFLFMCGAGKKTQVFRFAAAASFFWRLI